MEKALVSIIIPVYNGASYIKEAIESARGQTYSNIEVIVVDDGSTDNTREALKPYVDSGKIRYLFQENKGLSAARNLGIRNARGEFIALLDSDDIFLPQKLERQVSYLRAHPGCGVSYCDIFHFFEEKPEVSLQLKYDYYSGDEVFPHLLKKNFINPLTVVLRKSEIDRVGLFDESYRRSEDWEYWMRLVRHGVRFCHLAEPLAKYRIRKASLSYSWSSEIQRKATTLQIIRNTYLQMTAEEQNQYGMSAVLRMHRLKLWYAYAGTYFFPLRWIHKWRQQKRLV